MPELIEVLRKDYLNLSFVEGERFQWSPEDGSIVYAVNHAPSLLHEVSHALLGHTTYSSDLELLTMEAEAWEKALGLAKKYSVSIDPEHVQDCLDTYRDWLHRRSTCPACASHGVQNSERSYKCINCGTQWKVTHERFCRPYRLLEKAKNPA